MIKNFIVDPHPEEITISTAELGKAYEELKNENLQIARLETDTKIEEINGEKEPYRVLLISGKKSLEAKQCWQLEEIREAYKIRKHYEKHPSISN